MESVGLCRVLLPVAFLLSLLATDVAGIYCFQCNSYVDPECANIQPNDTMSRFYKPCEHNEQSIGKELFCRKTEQLIIDRENLVRIIRSCGWVMHPKYDCYTFWNKGHEDISCQCFSDGCNSAPIGAPSAILVLGLTFILSAFRLVKWRLTLLLIQRLLSIVIVLVPKTDKKQNLL